MKIKRKKFWRTVDASPIKKQMDLVKALLLLFPAEMESNEYRTWAIKTHNLIAARKYE